MYLQDFAKADLPQWIIEYRVLDLLAYAQTFKKEMADIWSARVALLSEQAATALTTLIPDAWRTWIVELPKLCFCRLLVRRPAPRKRSKSAFVSFEP